MPDYDDDPNQYLDQELNEDIPDDMPALICEVPYIPDAMPLLVSDAALPPSKSHVEDNDECSLKELLIRLLYQMPIQDHSFCLAVQYEIIRLHRENNLPMNPYTEDMIYLIIHAEDDPKRFISQFKKKLIVSEEEEKDELEKPIKMEDLYDKNKLYGMVRPYLQLLDKIHMG